MTTPMAVNEKLSKNDGIQKVDASIYRSLIKSLIYLTNTWSDIVHAVSIISRIMSESNKAILQQRGGFCDMSKRKSFGILYTTEEGFKLIGFTNSGWGGCINERKSASAYVF